MWTKNNYSIFSKSYSPIIYLLQAHTNSYEYDFQTVKSYVAEGKSDLNHTKLGALFYKIVTLSSTPSIALDELLKDKNTPKEWATIISTGRSLSIDLPSIAVNI